MANIFTPAHTPSLDELRLAYIDRMDFLQQIAHEGEPLTDEQFGAQFDRAIEELKKSK